MREFFSDVILLCFRACQAIFSSRKRRKTGFRLVKILPAVYKMTQGDVFFSCFLVVFKTLCIFSVDTGSEMRDLIGAKYSSLHMKKKKNKRALSPVRMSIF